MILQAAQFDDTRRNVLPERAGMFIAPKYSEREMSGGFYEEPARISLAFLFCTPSFDDPVTLPLQLNRLILRPGRISTTSLSSNSAGGAMNIGS